jgi:hypothetical protein
LSSTNSNKQQKEKRKGMIKFIIIIYLIIVIKTDTYADTSCDINWPEEVIRSKIFPFKRILIYDNILVIAPSKNYTFQKRLNPNINDLTFWLHSENFGNY